MEAKAILNADYLDIVFDNRNKTYGGYSLRKNYDERLRKAAMFVMLGIAAMLCFSFMATKEKDQPKPPARNKETIISNLVTVVPPPDRPKITQPPAAAAPKQLNTHIFTPPKILEDKDVPATSQLPKKEDIANSNPGTTNTRGDSASGDAGMSPGKGREIVTLPTANKPVIWVPQMPAFPGDLDEYINAHIHYPDIAKEENIQGAVLIEFVVNEDGSVSDAAIIKGIGGNCDQEALRMVSNMPRWKPGRQNNMPVKVLFRLPITFTLH